MSSRHSISIFRASAGIEHAPYRKEAPSTPGEEPILVERLAGALDAKSLPTRKSKESIVASAPPWPPRHGEFGQQRGCSTSKWDERRIATRRSAVAGRACFPGTERETDRADPGRRRLYWIRAGHIRVMTIHYSVHTRA